MDNNFWRLTLDTNPEDCNLHCIMCEEHSEWSNYKKNLKEELGITKRRMSAKMIENLFSQANDLGIKEIIPTTMGDPLVSNHIELIAGLARKNSIRLNVTHNGTFPGKSIKEWADLLIPISTDIKISWNGGTAQTAESIMKGLDFEKAKKSVAEFAEYRDLYYKKTGYYCRLSFQMTFLRNNIHEIEDIIKFASKIRIDRIKGHHVWAHFPELEEISCKTNEKSALEWNKIIKKAHSLINKLPQDKKVLLENFIPITSKLNDRVPEEYECPFLGKELWISATGKISPCCAPDKERDKLGDFGNINSKSLKEVIESKEYKYLKNNYKNYELCKTCPMRKPKK